MKTTFAMLFCITFFSTSHAQYMGSSVAIGATEVFPTGNLSNYFGSSTHFAMSLDLYFNNILLALQVSGSPTMKLKTPLLSQTTGYEYDFHENERFSYTDFGLLAGYVWGIYKQRLRFSPFVYLGGTYLQSYRFKYKDNKSEFYVFDTFFIGSGLRAEVELFRFNKEDRYNFIGIRLDVGYNIPMKYKYSPAKGNIPYARLALVWGGF